MIQRKRTVTAAQTDAVTALLLPLRAEPVCAVVTAKRIHSEISHNRCDIHQVMI